MKTDVSRRRLLQVAGGLSAAGLGGALVAPFARDVGYHPPTLPPAPPGPHYVGERSGPTFC